MTNEPKPYGLFLFRQPRQVHAVSAIPLFLVLGPPIGLLLLAVRNLPSASIEFGALFFGMLLSYAVGSAPALAAGAIYCLITLAATNVVPRVRFGARLSSLVGSIAAFAAAYIFFALLLPSRASGSTGWLPLVGLSAGSGAIVGFISGALFPVGRALSLGVEQSVEA